MDSAILRLDWPIGPEVDEWVGASGPRGWVAFKLKSGGFHIDTLEAVGEARGFSRLVGVEMSLDAALAALCGAFDASVSGLIQAAQQYFFRNDQGNSLPWKRIEPHDQNWGMFKERVWRHLQAEVLEYDAEGMVDAVDAALNTKGAALGWLEELRRLRNRAVHEQSLPRHIHAQVGAVNRTDWALSVVSPATKAGQDATYRVEHPVRYLREAQRKLTALTDDILGLADHLCPEGSPLEQTAQSVTVHVPPATASFTALPPEVIVSGKPDN